MLRYRQPLPVVTRHVLGQQHRLAPEFVEQCTLVSSEGGQGSLVAFSRFPAMCAEKGAHRHGPHLVGLGDTAEYDGAALEPLGPVEESLKSGQLLAHDSTTRRRTARSAPFAFG